MKIVHITDTHIHNLKYHTEYKELFIQLRKELERVKPDYIIHTGDIVHQKLVMSPELIELTREFLEVLRDQCLVLILLGNHDGLINNASRPSAIKPIVDLINRRSDQEKVIIVLDQCGEKNPSFGGNGVLNEKTVSFGVFSSFVDPSEWPIVPSIPEVTNIALYHGMVGSELHSGGVIGDDGIILKTKGGYLPLSTFKNYDYGLFGHVHEYQELDSTGKFVYGGSTAQTRFGESLQKGFWVWDIEGKNKFTKKFIPLLNIHPYYKITIPEGMANEQAEEYLSEYQMTNGCRLSLVLKTSDISNKEAQILLDKLVTKWNPIQSAWKRDKNVFSNSHTSSSIIASSGIDLATINSVETQCDLIQTHLTTNFGVTDSRILDKIKILHKKYHNEVQNVVRKEKPIGEWSLKLMVWSNLFRYGEDNTLVLENNQGSLVGIFGANKSGKTSVLDIISFVLFNRTSKIGNKLHRIINSKKTEADATIVFAIDGQDYKITRTLKRGKGATSTGTVQFSHIDKDGNDLKVIDANEIENYIGTFEDFLLSSYATQRDFLRFVEDGSTDRLKTFKNICDLNFFDSIIEVAKEEQKVLKKTLDKTDYQEALKQTKWDIETLENNIEFFEDEIYSKKKLIKTADQELIQAEAELIAYQGKDLDGLNVSALQLAVKNTSTELSRAQNDLVVLLEKEENLKIRYAEYTKKIATFDRNFLNEQIRGLEEDKHNFQQSLTKQEVLKREIANDQKAIDLIQGVPCKEHISYPYECQYVMEAVVVMDQADQKTLKLEQIILDTADFKKWITEKESSKQKIDEYNILDFEFGALGKEIESTKARIKDKQNLIIQYENKIEDLNQKIKRAEAEQEMILSYGVKTQTALTQRANKLKLLKEAELLQNKLNAEIQNKKYAENAAQKFIQTIETQLTMKDNLEVHEKYLKSIDGKTGLLVEIIKQILPYINNIIATILESVSDIEVFMDIDDGDNLEIFIRDNDQDEARTIAVASGMERQMSGVAIRMALLDVMKMSHCDTVFFDEPATALDAEHLMEFEKIMELFKNKFDKVFLITHMESLKDVVDLAFNVVIDDSGFSHLVE